MSGLYLSCRRLDCDGRWSSSRADGSGAHGGAWSLSAGAVADPLVPNVQFKPAPTCAGNLVGFATCTVSGHLSLSLLVVRVEAGLRVVFPKWSDRHGQRHHLVRPVNEHTRVAIEHAVLGATGRDVPR
jgi:DNA-binding cell septation regulator SpoVG